MLFTVEQHTIEFPAGPFALSNAMIMVSESCPFILGTQRMLPLLAIICSRTLVATLCRFCFLRVLSVMHWLTMFKFFKHYLLIWP